MDDLIHAGLDLYSPVAHVRGDGIVAEIQAIEGDLSSRVLSEPTPSQPSLRFLNQMEVRSGSEICLSNCSLFFREDDLDPAASKILNDLGIFQLPLLDRVASGPLSNWKTIKVRFRF